ncbi:MAG: hypothetical protein JXB05_22620, partial [Myxococcaceae bacterium]|nr:hypothetical protein [Myxococcaceae bacterium]
RSTLAHALFPAPSSACLPLSQTRRVNGYTLSIKLSDKELRTFCEHEIGGYPSDAKLPPYRMPKMYFSLEDINPQYVGWNGRIANVFAYMDSNPNHFALIPVAMGHALSYFESQSFALNTLGVMRRKVSEFPVPTPMDPDTPVFLYSNPDMYQRMLGGARHEVTQRLLHKLRSLAPT